MKTTVIYHSADFDGLFCREIAKKFLPDAELIGWNFGDPLIPMPQEGMVYILDLSPDCLDASQVETTIWNRLVWIDHHKTSIAKYDESGAFPKIAGYRIDGVAACRLAWHWFSCQPAWSTPETLARKEDFINRIVAEPLAVRLAGEYDIWDKRDPNTDTFQFALRSQELNADDWRRLVCSAELCGCEKFVSHLLEQGTALQRYQREQDTSVVKRAFDVEFEGFKFLALNTARCNSLTFESAAQPHHDGLMGFYWDGKTWRVSLYHSPHHKEHDLSVIAVKYGGGGHRGACGFSISKPPFIP